MFSRRSIALALLAAGIGCSGPDGAGALDAALSSASAMAMAGQVVVSLERSRATQEDRISTRSLFVRSRGMEADQVKTLLGLSDPEGLAPGECRLYDRSAALDEAAVGRADLQLLDAGTLSIALGSQAFTLDAQRYPDILPALSGFHYRDDRRDDRAVHADGDMVRVTGGGEEVMPFAGAAKLPEPPRLLDINGTARDSAAVTVHEIERTRPLVVEVSTDEAYVELTSGEPAMGQLLICRPQGLRVEVKPSTMGKLDAGDALLAATRFVKAPLQSGPYVTDAKFLVKGSETTRVLLK